jgi:hypothetical protein
MNRLKSNGEMEGEGGEAGIINLDGIIAVQ